MAAIASSISSPATFAHSITRKRNGVFFKTIFSCRISSKPLLSDIFFRSPSGVKRKSTFTATRPFSPVMEWQDCMAKMEVNVPCSVAYNCYNDREAIPRWMPFISSVKVLEDKPDLSRWSLKYEAFGRDLEFSWLARNMQPIPNQKIHWRSLEGLPNKGAVRFYPKGPSSCLIELTVSNCDPFGHWKSESSLIDVLCCVIMGSNHLVVEKLQNSIPPGLTVSYEIPQILTPVASALRPFLEGLLLRGLERFVMFAKEYRSDSRKV